MKIKIIDLLVKIANNEEVPKKIKYRDKIWKYTSTVKGRGYQYYSILYGEWKTLQNQVYLEECLNDEVEIIEETKKIKKIARCDDVKMTHYGELYKPTENQEILRIKVNELIDEINNLKEKKDE